MRKSLFLAAAPVAAASLAIVVSACTSGGTGAASPSLPNTRALTVASQSLPSIQIDVLNGEKAGTFGLVAPDGKGHDTFTPAHITAQAGTTYTIKVYNYDEGPHTFTIDAMNVNHTINPRVSDSQPSLTTFTVRFDKTGTFRFYCMLPCDAGHGGWAMTPDRSGKGFDQDGFMGGYVTVI